MKSEQVNLRLEDELVAAVEEVAREEALDRGTVIRRLLKTGVDRWRVDRALQRYRRGEISVGRASEEAGVTHWEMLDMVRAAGINYPLDAEQARRRLSSLAGSPISDPASTASSGFRATVNWLGRRIETLADLPPRAGGLLLVGINPAPVSVAAGHYYQGRLGKRLWARLARLGFLDDAVPGAEDEAFVRAGHGLTDVVKRPTKSSAELSRSEIEAGIEEVKAKVREWAPSLVLFAFRSAAEPLLETTSIRPGPGPQLEGVPTFLLSGPYASAAETQRIDALLRDMLSAARTGA